MYKLDKYDVKIEALLNPGFYILRNESATGKTYLTQVLHRYTGYGEPVGSYSYSNFSANEPLLPRLVDNLELFMLDRLDMYYLKLSQKEIDRLSEVSKFAIVLADLKGIINTRGIESRRTVISYPSIDHLVIGRSIV